MPHWPMMPRRAGRAHPARRQRRRRRRAESCTACTALTAAPTADAQPRPQQALRPSARPPQIPPPQAPALFPSNGVLPPDSSLSQSRPGAVHSRPRLLKEPKAQRLPWASGRPWTPERFSEKIPRTEPTPFLLSYVYYATLQTIQSPQNSVFLPSPFSPKEAADTNCFPLHTPIFLTSKQLSTIWEKSVNISKYLWRNTVLGARLALRRIIRKKRSQ